MKDCKILFFGTPNFAATILKGLIENNYNVVAIVSQPDKIQGRKKQLVETPTKVVGIANNIKVFQPIKLKADYEFLKDIDFDMIISAAYGQIIPDDVLAMSKINNINVHGSLLPSYRGGAPIQRAIMNGDKKTGITIMQMVSKMDAGLMYAKKEVDIDININTSDLFDKLALVGKDLLLSCIDDLIDNKKHGEVQDESKVSFAWNIKVEEEKLSFDDNCLNVHNKIRGLANNPGAYCYFSDKKLKIYKSQLSNKSNDNLDIGSLTIENKNHLFVKCNDGYIELLEIQLEGKQKMDVKSFLNGINKESLLSTKLI